MICYKTGVIGMPDILVVEDEYDQCIELQKILKREKYDTDIAQSAAAALEKLNAEHFDLVITDMKMPEMSGADLLREIKKADPDLPVIIITAWPDLKDAVELVSHGGAFYYIEKPIYESDKLNKLKDEIKKALWIRRGGDTEGEDSTESEAVYGFTEIIGRSPKMLQIYKKMARIIKHGVNPVLIMGESGTGKELVAKAIHKYGKRRNRKFAPVDCSTIPESLWESELFGHERGAFTSADTKKVGLIELANGGTLFLDEIGNISTAIQAKLLRVLETRAFFRIGGTEPIKVDICIIIATNKNLEEEIKNGNFKEDLYYRLNVIPLTLPPLRERKDDIPLLAEHFLNKFSKEYNAEPEQITPRAMSALRRYDWPGNVRQLENVLRQVFVLGEGNLIDLNDLPPEISKQPQGPAELSIEIPEGGVSLEEIEQQYLYAALKQTKGNVTKAAELLGISRRQLQGRMKNHNIARDEFKE
ncbi:sigma-54-dependent Fis family transcriptional regulator [Candidatus Poribacteria bacterium]|nr:sigma-54-dependent Fis family transcriptional regulator [Candidatus Poribacteria bacterium]